MSEENSEVDTVSDNKSVTVQLDEPIQRGEKLITEIRLKKPRTQQLRGISLLDIGQLDVSALQKLLPRITEPVLTTNDINRLDMSDLAAIAAAVARFLAQKADLN
jgi:hypothetical protein